jgi:hypothetical protein
MEEMMCMKCTYLKIHKLMKNTISMHKLPNGESHHEVPKMFKNYKDFAKDFNQCGSGISMNHVFTKPCIIIYTSTL